jgi:hypothetical protein
MMLPDRFCQVWRHRNKFSNFLACIALCAPDSDCTRLECIDGITHSGVFGASPDRTIAAYSDITGETWKPYEAPTAPAATVSRQSAAAEMAAFQAA